MSHPLIAKLGDPILQQQADPIKFPIQSEVLKDLKALFEALKTVGFGVGLAAPQIHKSIQAFFYRVPKDRIPSNESPVELTLALNPVWKPLSCEKVLGWEGCFSLPGLVAQVPRYPKIEYQYENLDGHTVQGEAEGYHARVFQHESDHLEGILLTQRIEDPSQLAFLDEARKFHNLKLPIGQRQQIPEIEFEYLTKPGRTKKISPHS